MRGRLFRWHIEMVIRLDENLRTAPLRVIDEKSSDTFSLLEMLCTPLMDILGVAPDAHADAEYAVTGHDSGLQRTVIVKTARTAASISRSGRE